MGDRSTIQGKLSDPHRDVSISVLII